MSPGDWLVGRGEWKQIELDILLDVNLFDQMGLKGEGRGYRSAGRKSIGEERKYWRE